jgi:hypothetical protein
MRLLVVQKPILGVQMATDQSESVAAQAAALGQALAESLGIRYGEISFTVRDGKVTHLHKRETVHLADDHDN